jgi:hypothetical protein
LDGAVLDQAIFKLTTDQPELYLYQNW